MVGLQQKLKQNQLMKNVNLIATLFFGVAVAFSSCKKDDLPEPIIPTAPSGNVVVTANISANTTWSADRVYQLGGRITVLDGATLTIEAGTIIKGEAGTGSNATALLVARGGKIMAEGDASKPIIFTSVLMKFQLTM